MGPTIFAKNFDLSEEHAIHLYSLIVTCIVKQGLCPDCNRHPSVDLTLAAIKKIPTILKKERDYIMFITGWLITNETYWEYFFQDIEPKDMVLSEEHLYELLRKHLRHALAEGRISLN